MCFLRAYIQIEKAEEMTNTIEYMRDVYKVNPECFLQPKYLMQFNKQYNGTKQHTSTAQYNSKAYPILGNVPPRDLPTCTTGLVVCVFGKFAIFGHIHSERVRARVEHPGRPDRGIIEGEVGTKFFAPF